MSLTTQQIQANLDRANAARNAPTNPTDIKAGAYLVDRFKKSSQSSAGLQPQRAGSAQPKTNSNSFDVGRSTQTDDLSFLTGRGDTGTATNQAAQVAAGNTDVVSLASERQIDEGGGVTETPRTRTQIQPSNETIYRVTLRPKPNQNEQLYGPASPNNILSILYDSNGVVFPYTPTIQSNFSAEYGQYSPVHSIMDFYAYKRTPAPTFTISGQFSAQNRREAIYCLAVIHFFRVVTKMYFGQGQNVGLTPPVLHLNGYGNFMLNNLPVIITNYSIELMNNVDYVRVNLENSAGSSAAINDVRTTPLPNLSSIAGASPRLNNLIGGAANINSLASTPNQLNQQLQSRQTQGEASRGTGAVAFVPSLFNIIITATVQHTPKQTREFSLNSFRSGELLTRSGWPVPGGGWW